MNEQTFSARTLVLKYHANPLPELPKAIVLCPRKPGSTDALDPADGVRLQIAGGKVIPPATRIRRLVTYAPDFAAEAAGAGRALTVRAKAWEANTLSQALLDGRAISLDTGRYLDKRGNRIYTSDVNGHFAFQHQGLAELYLMVMTSLLDARNNQGGSVGDFTQAEALDKLDKTLTDLGLSRGRVAYPPLSIPTVFCTWKRPRDRPFTT